MKKSFKIPESICFSTDELAMLTVCCSIDDSSDEIIELTNEAQRSFFAISKGEEGFKHNEKTIEALIQLGLIQSAEPNQESLPASAPSDYESMGISIKGFGELYTPELEAYGFTTLTVSASSSYSDSG